MQQTNPKVALQRLNLARDASFRQAKGIGGAGKTFQLRDSDEQLHCVNFIHAGGLLLFLMKQ